jgi:hypothetical protein
MASWSGQDNFTFTKFHAHKELHTHKFIFSRNTNFEITAFGLALQAIYGQMTGNSVMTKYAIENVTIP